MTIKKVGWQIFVLWLIVLPFGLTRTASGSEVNAVDTTGSIGFTGTYVPIGNPDPTPPHPEAQPPVLDHAKPGGSLPQTNDAAQPWLIWLGIILLSFVFIQWKQTHAQHKKMMKKAGTPT
ncbi:LPXTG cell wall anchor domain-containing protein [Enterococcus casseliflavus]|uniref:LPXTG cell wall anchor domain-containing protein n=1 Tax=Enterococcus casseliflavus TaxID=37734 RepID=UPI003EDED767